MDIRLTEDLKLTSDANNIILNERKIAGKEAKTPGEESWTAIKFYPTIEVAVGLLLEQGIKDSDAKTLEDLCEEMAHYARWIIRTIKGETK